jgi:thiamine biosynthesis lipoprotein
MAGAGLELWLGAPWSLAPAVLAAAAPPASAWVPSELATRERALALAFPGAASFEERTAILAQPALERLSRALRGTLSSRLLRASVARGPARADGAPGELLGFAVVDDVMGKSLPITYLAAFGPDASVVAVEVLVYRESHGGEVAERAFRAQFAGATTDRPLELGRDVRNVAGATISCRAITDGVHDLRLLVRELFAEPSAAQETASEAAPALGSMPARAALEPELVVRTRILMDSPLRIEVRGPGAEAAVQAAFDEIARLERLWSAFLAGSDVSRLAAAAGQAPIAIAPDTAALLAELPRWSALTGGAFDPLVGARSLASKRASFGAPELGIPALEVGLPPFAPPALEVESEACRARLSEPGLRIDLGAVAKGRALDRALDVLAGAGAPRALLDFGGQLAARVPEGDRGFDVGVGDPRDAGAAPLARLELCSGSLAVTSDNERGSAAASHLIDPRTLAPAATDLSCAAVHAATAAEADALSAGLYVAGWDAARRLALEHELAALLLARDGSLWTSPAFEALAAGRARAPQPVRR